MHFKTGDIVLTPEGRRCCVLGSGEVTVTMQDSDDQVVELVTVTLDGESTGTYPVEMLRLAPPTLTPHDDLAPPPVEG